MTLAPGEQLFGQGDASDRIYLVRSGAVDILRRTVDGGDELVNRRRAGEWFGEMGPLFSLPRSAAARAFEPTVVEGYSVQGFRSLVGTDGIHQVIEGSPADATPAAPPPPPP
jgi:putative ABC transport system ATP-binding protein